MRSDPVESQESATVPSSDNTDDFIAHEIDPEDDQPATRTREGLPAGFRMRHSPHHVEQLMGEAPLRTVREIAVADIEQPPDDPRDLQELERSVRELGVLEPLLVAQQGRGYRVITGMNRLRAAARAGLRSVPCLVHDADDETIGRMRAAACAGAAACGPVHPVSPETAPASGLAPAFAETTAALTFLSELLPAISAAAEDRFRSAVLTDLAAIELMRARRVTQAAEVLSFPAPLRPVQSRLGDLMASVVTAAAPEARLRGLCLQAAIHDPDYRIVLDLQLVTTALSGIVQAMLAFPASTEAILRVDARGTAVRPAMMVEISRPDVVLDAAGVERFFQPDWVEHPAGRSAVVMFAGGERIARLHAGRLGVQALTPAGCTVTFVVPRDR